MTGPAGHKGLHLFNSLSRRKELFNARQPDRQVGIYVCGITPYDTTHIGHAFTYVHFDVLVRYLRWSGYRVTYVQNLTDIDDDILRVAAEKKADWRAFGEANADRFLSDMQWLGNLSPDIYPRASDIIADMIVITRGLLQGGQAYENNGSVYFSVAAYPSFGELSGLPPEQWLATANQHGNHPDDPGKRDPLDFVLWQARRPGEPFWESPWGPGRPGWHIECSAMATRFLGPTVDIHGGGHDLIFPHHECSSAQSQSYHGRPFARFWLHTGMVHYEKEKMSKSLGNMVFIRDLREHGAATVRLCLLSHSFSESWSFEEDLLRTARQSAELFQHMRRSQSGSGAVLDVRPYAHRFYEALDDNLDTPTALKVLQDLARHSLGDPQHNIADAKALLDRAHSMLGLESGYGRT